MLLKWDACTVEILWKFDINRKDSFPANYAETTALFALCAPGKIRHSSCRMLPVRLLRDNGQLTVLLLCCLLGTTRHVSSELMFVSEPDDWQVIATPPTNQRPAFGHPQTSGHHRKVEPDIFPNPNPRPAITHSFVSWRAVHCIAGSSVRKPYVRSRIFVQSSALI